MTAQAPSLTLRQIAELLGCEVLSGQQALDAQVPAVFAADLMSDVLMFAEHGALLITGLSSLQSVHTAEVADLCGVLLVGNKRPHEEALAVAKSRELPLMLTEHGMYGACGLLYSHGVQGVHGQARARKP